MKIEIISPEKILYSGEVSLVKVPGAKGSFEILKNHAPIVSTLVEGEIKIKEISSNEITFHIFGGIIEASGNSVSIAVHGIKL